MDIVSNSFNNDSNRRVANDELDENQHNDYLHTDAGFDHTGRLLRMCIRGTSTRRRRLIERRTVADVRVREGQHEYVEPQQPL